MGSSMNEYLILVPLCRHLRLRHPRRRARQCRRRRQRARRRAARWWRRRRRSWCAGRASCRTTTASRARSRRTSAPTSSSRRSPSCRARAEHELTSSADRFNVGLVFVRYSTRLYSTSCALYSNTLHYITSHLFDERSVYSYVRYSSTSWSSRFIAVALRHRFLSLSTWPPLS